VANGTRQSCIGEACISKHERGLANDLWRVAIRVGEDGIEHLAIADDRADVVRDNALLGVPLL